MRQRCSAYINLLNAMVSLLLLVCSVSSSKGKGAQEKKKCICIYIYNIVVGREGAVKRDGGGV